VPCQVAPLPQNQSFAVNAVINLTLVVCQRAFAPGAPIASLGLVRNNTLIGTLPPSFGPWTSCARMLGVPESMDGEDAQLE
jgi:hypothetical protein